MHSSVSPRILIGKVELADLWSSLSIEHGYSDAKNLPFEIRHLPHPGRTGVAQAVQRNKNSIKAVCDVRGDGIPIGW